MSHLKGLLRMKYRDIVTDDGQNAFLAGLHKRITFSVL